MLLIIVSDEKKSWKNIIKTQIIVNIVEMLLKCYHIKKQIKLELKNSVTKVVQPHSII